MLKAERPGPLVPAAVEDAAANVADRYAEPLSVATRGMVVMPWAANQTRALAQNPTAVAAVSSNRCSL